MADDGAGLAPHETVWAEYAGAAEQRGAELVKTLRDGLGIPFPGVRILDIGCGEGGFVMAAARSGAEVVGVELNARSFGIAVERTRGQTGARVMNADIMDREVAAALGAFDVFVCDNVIEHVFSAAKLIGACSRLLNAGGKVWMTTPNAFSIGQVARECHYQLPAMSLADPVAGAGFLRDRLGITDYDVSWYERYGHYVSLFERYGFATQQLLPVDGSDAAVEAAAARFADVEVELRAVEPLLAAHPAIRNNLDRWRSELTFDFDHWRHQHDPGLRRRIAEAIVREHVIELWYFWLTRE